MIAIVGSRADLGRDLTRCPARPEDAKGRRYAGEATTTGKRNAGAIGWALKLAVRSDAAGVGRPARSSFDLAPGAAVRREPRL